jgi:hypothetical protein
MINIPLLPVYSQEVSLIHNSLTLWQDNKRLVPPLEQQISSSGKGLAEGLLCCSKYLEKKQSMCSLLEVKFSLKLDLCMVLLPLEQVASDR